MATIGSLAVNIVATTDKFIAGLNSATSQLNKWGKQIANVGNLIAGVGVAAMVSLVNSAIEAGSKIQELTVKLHISAEALTALHFAADQLDSSAAAVDTALQKMSLALGKALEGNTQAIASFMQLGLSVNTVASLSTEQQFLAIVDAIRAIPDPARQAEAAMGVFGKSYAAVLPLIRAGSDEIIKQGQAAADLGAIMTTETISSLDATGDAITSLGATWASLKINAVAAFTPVLDWVLWLASGAITAIRAFVEFFRTALSGIATYATATFKFIAEGINYLLPKFAEFDTQKIQSYQDEFSRAATESGDRFNKIVSGGSANPLAPTNGADGKTAAAQLEEQKKTNTLLSQTLKKDPVTLKAAGVR